MKKKLFIVFFLMASCILLRAQIYGECMPVFNGRDLTGWNPGKPGSFEVVNAELITRSSGAGNDIYTTKQYSNFILRLEFLLSEVGNSGVFIRRDPSKPGSGFEVQLLAPWTPWRDDLHCTGSLYGHVAVQNRPDETTGRWYKMEIKCDRNLISVSVNNKITTRADCDTVKTLADKPVTGFIGFQGNHAEKESQFAKFRNICIIDLDADSEYVINGFYTRNALFRDQAVSAAVNLGPEMIEPLSGLLSDQDPAAANSARQALFDIAAKASDPSLPSKARKETWKALRKTAASASSPISAEYLRWLNGMIKK